MANMLGLCMMPIVQYKHVLLTCAITCPLVQVISIYYYYYVYFLFFK